MVASPPTFHPQADAPPAEPPALTASPPLPPMPAPITSLRILPASTPPPPEHSVVATLRSSHVVYVARSPTGLPLLQVGLSDDAGHPPEPENSTQAVDGVEGAEWRLVSEELPGGISVWTASDPHPADELTTPQHAHAYVSDVRVTLSDDAEAMARKGWQTLNLVSGVHSAALSTRTVPAAASISVADLPRCPLLVCVVDSRSRMCCVWSCRPRRW